MLKACGSILLGFVAAVVVAGCSSNNDHGTGACGDGVVDSGEQCDDGNTVSGDGCSSVCKIETAGSICGDGIVDVATEGCDDGNTVSGDGCSSDCRVEVHNPCGNGTLDTGETCDDGNATGGDGCGTTCQVEMGFMCTGSPSVCTAVPVATGTCAAPVQLTLAPVGSISTATVMGDTTANANQVDAGVCNSELNAGAGHDQIFTFTTTIAQRVVLTLNNHVTSTAFDGVLRLATAACDLATDVNGNVVATGGIANGCSDSSGSSGSEVLTYASLDAGTYFIVVDGYSSTANGAFSITVDAGTATCGNGVIESGEGCDDHNVAAGDGCSATCAVENGYTCTGTPSVCTVVAGSCADSGTIALTHTGTAYDGTVTGNTTTATNSFAGGACDGFTNAGAGPDQGWKFVNPVAQQVTVSLDGSFDATLRLMTTPCDVATSLPETETNPTIASDGCAEQQISGTAEVLNYPNLPAGTYYVVADGYSSSSMGTYTLTVHGQPSTCGNGTLEADEVCDDHNTTNNDGCTSECAVQPGYACIGTPSVCHPIVCGDGHVDAGEDCDDHNTTAGDGCDAACHVEAGHTCSGSPSVCVLACGNGDLDPGEECDAGTAGNARCTATCTLKFDTTETEPNDTAAAAQVITPVHQIIKGSLTIGDRDVFKFTLAAPATVSIETYNAYSTNYVPDATTASVSALGLQCVASADTLVFLYTSAQDPTQDTTVVAKDDDDGDAACSYLGPLNGNSQGMLAAGTYYFTIHEYQLNDPITPYLVDFSVN